MSKRDKLLNGIHRAKIPGSFKTVYNHKMEAMRFLRTLRQCGYGVQKWQNITNKHVAAVVSSWKEKGLSDKTIKEYLSGVRAVARAYNNERITSDNSKFGLERTSFQKNIDKSANEKIYKEVVERLEKSENINEQRLAVQLQYMRELGLRAEEARKLDAIHAPRERSPEGKEYIRVVAGTKGGKERWVSVSEKAREALEKGAEIQKQTGTKNLMDPTKTERQWEKFAYSVARNLGMTRENGCTFHSLRHSFAQDRFREVAGFDPPCSFKSVKEFFESAKAQTGQTEEKIREKYETACQVVEKELGHEPNRVDIRGVYIGKI